MAPLARFVVGTAATMPDCSRRIAPAAGSTGRTTARMSSRPRRASTDRSSTISSATGSARCRTSPHDSRPARAASRTWPAGRAGRRSPSPAAFPGVHVDGIDIDEGSIARARSNAEAAGATDVVVPPRRRGDRGRCRPLRPGDDLRGGPRHGPPGQVLATARGLLAPGGAVLIADERVAETFTAPGDETERLFYAYSVLACLANGLVDQPSVGTGTVLRPAALESIASEAGFSGFTILPDRARRVPLLPPRPVRRRRTVAAADAPNRVVDVPIRGAILRREVGRSEGAAAPVPGVLAFHSSGQSRAPRRGGRRRRSWRTDRSHPRTSRRATTRTCARWGSSRS